MTKYEVKYSNVFKKSLKKSSKQGKDIDKSMYVIKKLANDDELILLLVDTGSYSNLF